MEIDELKGVWFVKICGFLKFEDLRKSDSSPQTRLSTGAFVFQIKSQDVCVINHPNNTDDLSQSIA